MSLEKNKNNVIPNEKSLGILSFVHITRDNNPHLVAFSRAKFRDSQGKLLLCEVEALALP